LGKAEEFDESFIGCIFSDDALDAFIGSHGRFSDGFQIPEYFFIEERSEFFGGYHEEGSVIIEGGGPAGDGDGSFIIYPNGIYVTLGSLDQGIQIKRIPEEDILYFQKISEFKEIYVSGMVIPKHRSLGFPE
jgi:hypothetical protein